VALSVTAGRKTVTVSGRFTANSLDALVSAARSGAGIARVPSWQVAGDIAAGRLTHILASYERSPAPVHLLFQHTKLSSPKIRTFVDYLTEQWKAADASVQVDSHQNPKLRSAGK